ncbi:MAG: heptaprenyl diphosphate synthase [Firmicutes bacterium HGW-Firmicutes-15]|nr:MAG: heptaprenyl diphosphate synthase [Firmicutes bacterium HGW-Firmicutes-15]
MTGFDLFTPINNEMIIVEERLIHSIDTELPELNQAATHLVKAGGKRLRPAFTLLVAKLFADSVETVIPMAVALELTHMATLVHDDVIDNSRLRRGQPTVKNEWGNRISIYSGNYVFAKSLCLVAGYQRSDLLKVLADASMRICEGEIRQMLSCYNIQQGMKDYLRRIERKTALLISVSCQLGAMISQASEGQITALKRYGYYLGMAFQITDDILDFVADEEILGKPVGSDIRQGVITLPAIYALKYGNQREQLGKLLSSPELCTKEAEAIIALITETDGMDYAYHVSNRFADKARQQLDLLPDVPVKKSLYDIASFISGREY